MIENQIAHLLPECLIPPELIPVTQANRRKSFTAIEPDNTGPVSPGVIHDLQHTHRSNRRGYNLIDPQPGLFPRLFRLGSINPPNIITPVGRRVNLWIKIRPALLIKPLCQRIPPRIPDGSCWSLNVAGSTNKE